MALEPAGVELTAKNYDSYLKQMREIERAHKAAFSDTSFKAYEDALKRLADTTKSLPKTIPTPKLPPPEDAKRLQAALDTLGKSGKYAIAEVDAEVRKLDEALKTVQKSGQFQIQGKFANVGDLTKKLDDALAAPKSASGFSGLIKTVTGDVGDLTGMLGGLIGKFTLVAGAIKLVNDTLQFFSQAINVAQRNETLRVSLEEVGGAAGYTSKQIELAIGLLNKQGITTQASQQSLMRMARANISWAEASKLAAIAQGSAVVAGMNSSDAFNRLVTGIQKMEPELLDELGITLRRTDAYDKYAASVGKNAKSLTDQEKQQAILNEIYRQSEAVLGVYDAAMETSGKKQASLARLIEETQNNVGKLLLPLQETSVEMQTNFWKGAQQVSKALQSWAPLLSGAIPSGLGKLPALIGDWVSAMMGLKEGQSFIDRISEGIYNFGRMFVVTLTFTRTVGETVINEMIGGWGKFFEMVSEAAKGEFGNAAVIAKSSWGAVADLPNEIGRNFQTNLLNVLEEYPDLMKSWDEVNAAVEGSAEDLRLETDQLSTSIEDQEAAIEKLIDSLEATKDAYKKAKDIQQNFQESQTKAKAEYEKGLKEAEKKYLAERAKMVEEFNKKLAEFDAESARKRAQMIDDFEFQQANRLKEFNLQRQQSEDSFNLKVAQDKRKFYDDQKRALRDFQLNMMQAQRQFSITDRRLRADGDVLALMEAREDFELQQQESKENYKNTQQTAKEAYEEQQRTASENFMLQEQQARESFALQTEIQRQEFQRRLEEYDANIAQQREKMLEAHAQELADLDAKYEEEKAKLFEQYQEKLATAQEQRDEQLKALGDSLKEEGRITEEGMKEIATKISEVFGDEAAGDKLIQGWSERSQDEINNVVDEITAKINELKESMENASTAIQDMGSGTKYSTNPSSYGNVPGNPNAPGYYGQGDKPIGARHGFQGVVMGPKTFKIEPGMKEHVQITPLNRGGNVKHSGAIGMNLNVSGMGGNMDDQLAQAIIEKASGAVVEGLKMSIRRLSRRGN